MNAVIQITRKKKKHEQDHERKWDKNRQKTKRIQQTNTHTLISLLTDDIIWKHTHTHTEQLLPSSEFFFFHVDSVSSRLLLPCRSRARLLQLYSALRVDYSCVIELNLSPSLSRSRAIPFPSLSLSTRKENPLLLLLYYIWFLFCIWPLLCV